MTRFVTIVMVVAAGFLIWLIFVTFVGCQTRSILLDMQSAGLRVNTNEAEVQNKVDSLETDLKALSSQIEQLAEDQAEQVPTETDINIRLRGDWTLEEQRQLERILQDAINNP
jgi:peptidoglycan hydrolase CwlO-like protein